MRQILFFFVFCILASEGDAQIYLADSCRITFFSETKAENIDASNTISKPIMSIANGELDVSINNAFFEFKDKLMQEHFNEDYMETAKYPKTVFAGKIDKAPDYSQNGTDSITVTGTMDMHGVKKIITIPGTITILNGVFFLKTKFNLRMEDYNIKVPEVLSINVASSVEVTFTATMKPYEAKK